MDNKEIEFIWYETLNQNFTLHIKIDIYNQFIIG